MTYLFSYGTLRYPQVQRDLYGRDLVMREDAIPGYVLSQVEITKQDVLARSDKCFHPTIRYTGNSNDIVKGVVVELTEQELTKSNEYEVDDYQRNSVTTVGNKQAWVYAESPR